MSDRFGESTFQSKTKVGFARAPPKPVRHFLTAGMFGDDLCALAEFALREWKRGSQATNTLLKKFPVILPKFRNLAMMTAVMGVIRATKALLKTTTGDTMLMLTTTTMRQTEEEESRKWRCEKRHLALELGRSLSLSLWDGMGVSFVELIRRAWRKCSHKKN